MPTFFGLNNGSDAITVEKRKIHELLSLVVKGFSYADAYRLSLNERRYMIDLLNDNVKETTNTSAEMNELAKKSKIRKIDITENKLKEEHQVNDQRTRKKAK